MSRKSAAAAREQRRKQVATNLLAGLNYREMAEALGVSIGTITEDVRILMGRWQREQVETVDDYLQLSERRLDRALNAIWGDVLDGDLKAIDRMLRIEERRAKLRGLDQPQEIKHSGSVDQHHHRDFEGLEDAGLDKLIDNLLQTRARDAGDGAA